MIFEVIFEQTKVTKPSLYKIRAKAKSRGWEGDGILETWHMDDAPRPGRPKTSTATALFIIETVTRNSTTGVGHVLESHRKSLILLVDSLSLLVQCIES